MTIKSQIDAIIAAITAKQAEILKKNILVTFIMGWKASGTRAPISALQKEQIKAVYSTNLGAIEEFNSALGEQMRTTIQDRIAKGGSYSDIKSDITKYVTQTFGENGVTIDRTGQKRTVIEVGKDGSLSRVEKTITRPYTSTIQNYSDMLAKTSAHSALEAGRAEGYKKQGVKKVRFVGPNFDDERARPWHAILVGNVYEVDSEDYYMALDILSEPNCRHRFVPFMDNPEIDTPQSVFDKRRADSGVFYDEHKGQWALPEQ